MAEQAGLEEDKQEPTPNLGTGREPLLSRGRMGRGELVLHAKAGKADRGHTAGKIQGPKMTFY